MGGPQEDGGGEAGPHRGGVSSEVQTAGGGAEEKTRGEQTVHAGIGMLLLYLHLLITAAPIHCYWLTHSMCSANCISSNC